jgi:sortase (surface protein transpeptidase)
MIYLRDADGAGATYQVTAVTIVDAEIDAGEVVRDKEADTLTLITCGGDFDGAHYLSRIIVESVRV